MPILYNKIKLENIAKSIRQDLLANNIKIKHMQSRQLVSRLLVDKNWSELSPSLPKEIIYPDHANERMLKWLFKHKKFIELSECKTILKKYFDVKDNEVSTVHDLSFLEFLPSLSPDHDWTYLNGFIEIGNQNMPLYQEDDESGRPQSSILILDPENETISAQKYIEQGNKAEVCGREYIFSIPSEISGRALVSLLQCDMLNDLIESISDSYEIIWDGHDNIGDISEEAQQKLIEFRQWLSTTQFDSGEVL